MEPATMWLIGIGILGAILALIGIFWAVAQSAKKKAARSMAPTVLMILGFATVVLCILVGLLMASFTGAVEDQASQEVLPEGEGITADCQSQKVIEDLRLEAIEAITGDSGIFNGTFQIYRPGEDPGDATVDPRVSITIADGVATHTGKNVATCDPYRVVVNGASKEGLWYSEDLGEITFDDDSLNENTGVLRYEVPVELYRVANLTDMFDETSTSLERFNGQTNTSITNAASKIGCAADCGQGDTIIYDESQGAGNAFYVRPRVITDGPDGEWREPVLCFRGESDSAAPEGDEFSSIRFSSSDQLSIEGGVTDLVDVFAAEGCVGLLQNGNDVIRNGVTAEFELKFDPVNSAIDTNDDFKVYLDDLSDFKGEDVLGDNGQGFVSMDFDAQA